MNRMHRSYMRAEALKSLRRDTHIEHIYLRVVMFKCSFWRHMLDNVTEEGVYLAFLSKENKGNKVKKSLRFISKCLRFKNKEWSF